MRVQEIEWMPSPPQANPLYEKMLKKVRQCGEAKDTARRDWEEAEEFVADCSLLPSELKEEIRMYYADAFAALAAEYSRSREQLLVLGYDNYD